MSTPPEAVPAKPRRRWRQYSLRALLVLTLIVAAIFGWLRYEMDRYQREEEAVAAITNAGGVVSYEDYSRTGDRRGPRWLRPILGDRFFERIAA